VRRDGEFRADPVRQPHAPALQNLHYLLTGQAVTDHPLPDRRRRWRESALELPVRW